MIRFNAFLSTYSSLKMQTGNIKIVFSIQVTNQPMTGLEKMPIRRRKKCKNHSPSFRIPHQLKLEHEHIEQVSTTI